MMPCTLNHHLYVGKFGRDVVLSRKNGKSSDSRIFLLVKKLLNKTESSSTCEI